MWRKVVGVCFLVTVLLIHPSLTAPPTPPGNEGDSELEQADYSGTQTQVLQHASTFNDDKWNLYGSGVISVSEDTTSGVPSGGNETKSLTDKIREYFNDNKWMFAVVSICGIVIVCAPLVICITCCLCWQRKNNVGRRRRGYMIVCLEDSTDMSNGSHQEVAERIKPKRPLECTEEDDAVRYFLDKNEQYKFSEKLDDLGSRMKKCWYAASMKQGEERLCLILTVAPLSASCPLQMHKHQKGLNKLLGAIKVHPFIHPILEVAYLAGHEKLVTVQPRSDAGSLKDLIYKVTHPTVEWSQKYGSRGSGLSPDLVARYGRQILEAMEFLYHTGFPPALGHVQSGNIFVIDGVCKLGGYENTLLGYKTRLFRLCRDHIQHFDIILFGHLIFEMSAGYELKTLAPGEGDYKTAHKAVVPVLQYIFDEELSHRISDIKGHTFFDVLLPELKHFKPADVQLTDSMKVVLEKVRKNKPRVQKPPSSKLFAIKSPTATKTTEVSQQDGDQEQKSQPSSWKERFHMPKQFKQLFTSSKKKDTSGGEESERLIKDSMDGVSDDDEPLLDIST